MRALLLLRYFANPERKPWSALPAGAETAGASEPGSPAIDRVGD